MDVPKKRRNKEKHPYTWPGVAFVFAMVIAVVLRPKITLHPSWIRICLTPRKSDSRTLCPSAKVFRQLLRFFSLKNDQGFMRPLSQKNS